MPVYFRICSERRVKRAWRRLFHTVAVHSQWNYHFITALLSSNSYIFCTSDPHHTDGATSPVYLLSCYLCPSEPIFRNLPTSSGVWTVPYTWAYTAYLFNFIFRCSVPVQAGSWLQIAVYRKSLKTFFNWTPGITLKSLWSAWNQKFIWDIFKSGEASAAHRGAERSDLMVFACSCNHVCVIMLSCMCLPASMNVLYWCTANCKHCNPQNNFSLVSVVTSAVLFITVKPVVVSRFLLQVWCFIAPFRSLKKIFVIHDYVLPKAISKPVFYLPPKSFFAH